MTLKERAIKMGLHEDASETSVLAAERAAFIAEGRAAADSEHRKELARQTAIRELAASHAERLTGITARAEQAVRENVSVEAFRTEILDSYKGASTLVRSSAPIGSDEKRLTSGFSLRKFMLGAMNGENLTGAEREVQQEGQREASARGLDVGPGYIPAMVFGEIAKRAGQNATTNSEGKYLVATENIGLIGALSPRLWMSKLGVTMLSGLVNNITLPSVETEGEAADKTEVENNSAVDIVLGQRTLSPTRIPTACVFSSQLLRQSSPQIEGVLSNILLSRIARRWNAKAIEYIIALSGTGSIVTAGAPLDHAIMRGFLTTLGTDNADEQPGAFLINSAVEGVLATTKLDAGSGLFLHTENGAGEGRILNRRSVTTNLMADTNIIFGAFQRLWMGDWGGVDLIRDNVTKAATGELVLTATSFIGFAAEHAKYFVTAEDVDVDAIVS